MKGKYLNVIVTNEMNRFKYSSYCLLVLIVFKKKKMGFPNILLFYCKPELPISHNLHTILKSENLYSFPSKSF